MTAQQAATLVRPTETPCTGDEICHFYCCDEDLSLCGKDISGTHVCPDDDSCGCDECVVCDDLADLPCPVCGE